MTRYAFLSALYCVFWVLIINYLISNYPSLYFGKDGGLVTMTLLTWLASCVMFLFIEKTFFKYFIGLIVGICSCLITYISYYLLAAGGIVEEFSIPLIGDNIIEFTFIFLFGLYRIKKNNRL